MVSGDLCQLPSVRPKPVLILNETETMEGFISMDLWKKFRLAELDQIMRQDDEMFVNFLNKIRVGKIDQNLENVIKSKFIDKDDLQVLQVLHIFAENAPVKRHNDNQLKQIPGKLIYLKKMKFLKILKFLI